MCQILALSVYGLSEVQRMVLDVILLVLLFASLLVGLFLATLGLPGPVIAGVVAAIYVALSSKPVFGWTAVIIFLIAGVAAEAFEFASTYWGAKAFGRSSRSTAWAAFIGGLVGGAFGTLGLPIAFLGTLVGSLAGTFLAALLVEAKNQPRKGAKAGLGALLGRIVAFIVKAWIILAFSLFIIWKLLFPHGMPDIFQASPL